MLALFVFALLVVGSTSQLPCTCGGVVPTGGSCSIPSTPCNKSPGIILNNGAVLNGAGANFMYSGTSKNAIAVMVNVTAGGTVTITNYMHIHGWGTGINVTGNGTLLALGTSFQECRTALYAGPNTNISISQNYYFQDNKVHIQYDTTAKVRLVQGSLANGAIYGTGEGQKTIEFTHSSITNGTVYSTAPLTVRLSAMSGLDVQLRNSFTLTNASTDKCNISVQSYNGQSPYWLIEYAALTDTNLDASCEDGDLVLERAQITRGAVYFGTNGYGSLGMHNSTVNGAKVQCSMRYSNCRLYYSNFTNTPIYISQVDGSSIVGVITGGYYYMSDLTVQNTNIVSAQIQNGNIQGNCATSNCSVSGTTVYSGTVQYTGYHPSIISIANCFITSSNISSGLNINTYGSCSVRTVSVVDGTTRINGSLSCNVTDLLEQRSTASPTHSLVLSSWGGDVDGLTCDNAAKCCISVKNSMGTVSGVNLSGAGSSCLCCSAGGTNNVTVTALSGATSDCSTPC